MRILLVILLTQTLIACSGRLIQHESDYAFQQAMIPTNKINVERRETIAQELLDNQDFYASLTQWKILQTINPSNPQYANQILSLEALIERRIKLFLVKSKDSLEVNDLRAAEMSLLKALALDPNNLFALKMMRNIESQRMQKAQILKTEKLRRKRMAKYVADKKRRVALTKKVEQQAEDEEEPLEVEVQEAAYLEMGVSLYKAGDWNGAIREINKYLSTNKSNRKVQNILQHSHLKLSEVFAKQGHWDPAMRHMDNAFDYVTTWDMLKKMERRRDELHLRAAESYYIEGVKVFRDNIDKAIAFWQQSLHYNPEHSKAKDRLLNAKQSVKNGQDSAR